MRKLFVFNLLFWWGLHVLMPLIYFFVYRGSYVFLYGLDCPNSYLLKAAGIISLPLLASVLIIVILPRRGKRNIEPFFGKRMEFLLYFACVISIIKLGLIGDYANSSIVNGTIISYLGLLFDAEVFIILLILLEYERVGTWFCIIAFAGVTILASSRSGLLTIVWAILMMLVATRKYISLRKWIYLFVFFACILAPLTFRQATVQRGRDYNGMALFDTIAGRCSYLEQVGGALYQRDNNLWNQEVFDRKYAISNQIKMCANQLVIGDIFESDVNPNQYFRATFMGYSEELCKSAYTSINLSLPGYLTIKYGGLFGCLLSISFILLFYILILSIQKRRIVAIIMATLLTNNLLDYFDWVMMLRDGIRVMLSVITFSFVYWLWGRFCSVKLIWLKHVKIQKWSRV